jgi:hypothetical protein
MGELSSSKDLEGERGEQQRPLEWDDRLEAVLDDWHRRAWAASIAHYRRASQLHRSNIRLGLPVVVLTAVVGTSLFATLGEERLPIALRIVVGTVSVCAAVLAAVQTFFGFAQRADQHVLAADWYASLRRKIEQMRAIRPEIRGDARKTLDELRRDFNQVGSQFPQIGDKDWERTARRFGIGEPPRRGPDRIEDKAGRHGSGPRPKERDDVGRSA